MPENAVQPCFWCRDTTPNHRHYTVLCYKNGKCVGRLGADGYAVTRKIFALVLNRERADEIAAEINADGQFTAKVRPF